MADFADSNNNMTATREQIHELPRKYAIGKRPLSLLLGWGELTYTRLLDGRTPNAAHSAEIVMLLENPAMYARILEIGRESELITEAAYKKSRCAVDALLEECAGSTGEPHDSRDSLKIFDVADRLCALSNGDLTPRTLQALMSLAQESARETGIGKLFEQDPIPTDHGPEFPQIASTYSFKDIQAASERLKEIAQSFDPEAAAAFDATAEEQSPATESGTPESVAAEEVALEEDSGKKGKKGKKDKKAKKGKKDKGGKKGKKADRKLEQEESAAEDAEAAEAEGSNAAEPTAADVCVNGALSPAECQVIDAVFARYNRYLQDGFARSFR